MSVLVPNTLAEALDALAAHPGAHVLAGGTDFMVEVNFAHRRPESVVVIDRVPELRGWRHDPAAGTVTIGAGLTYREMIAGPLADLVPALAQAARTVGSPQIRNAGTLGGNLGTGSPAGDGLPVLSALDARITLASLSGRRELYIHDFLVGPKRTAMASGEVIVEVTVPVVRGPQEFLKVGTRNAMVIAIASTALVVDLDGRSVRAAFGAVGPVIIRARDAEAWIAERVDWPAARLVEDADAAEFARRCAGEVRPIDDHRSTAAYRRHAVEVMARRALERAFGVSA